MSIVDLKAGDKIEITFSVANAGSSTDKHFTVENAGTGSTTNLSLSSGGEAIAANTDMVSGTTYYVLEDGYVDFKTRKNFYLSKVVITSTYETSNSPVGTEVTPKSATLSIGQKTTLTGSFLGGEFTGEWVSDNEDVATVSSAGLVTAVAAGTANITYQWTEDQSEAAYKATAVITVINKPLGTTVTPASTYVIVGKTTTLTGSFTAGDFTGEWVSDNEAVATVSETGVVTGVSEGTANITYQWTENQSEDAYKATAAVTVVEAFDKNGLAVVKNYDFANWGKTTLAIGSTAEGKIYNAANKVNNDVFRCTNEGLTSIAIQAVIKDNKGWTINNDGLYEGSGAGRCAAVCDVKAGQYIEFNHNSTTEFYTKNYNEDAGVKKAPLVEESNHHVYKVLEDGMVGFELVKGHYVTSINIYEKKSGTPTSLTFSAETAEATLGVEFTEPTLTKDPAGLTGVVFSSTNTAVATVDAETGEVTPLAAGKTNIKATFTATDEYWGAEASYELTVIDPNNKTVTATFAFSTGAEGQTAVVDVDNVFSVTGVNVADMNYNGAVTFAEVTGTKMRPKTQASDDKSQYTKFTVTPKKGITFTPTKIEFDALRIATDGDKKLHYYAESGTTSTELGNVNPNRNNDKFDSWSHYSHDISDITATSTSPFSLACYVYGLGTGKDIAFANVVITGTYSGEAQDETMYDIATSVTPDGAGSVSQNPAGASLAEGTAVSFTATANAGYVFLNKWTVNGTEVDGETYSVESLSENLNVVAQFQKLFAVSFAAGEGADKGTTPNALNTVYVESTYTTPAANYYISKPGFTATGWTDGTNDYGFGEVITVVNDIVLQPIFEANTASFTDIYTKDIVVNYNFDPTKGAPVLNIENVTGYYVQQATINGKKIDMPMYINNVKGSAIEGKTGKTNNTSSNATTAQINEGSKFTIAAIPGMKVTLNASNNISTTTVGGAEPTTGSGSTTATYIYAGEAGTTDIVFGNDGRYYSSIVVTYPRTAIEKTISEAGYATHCSSFALDFSNVEGLTAYIATMNGSTVNFTAKDDLPAGVGMLLKGAQGTYTIPVIANSSNDDATTGNKFVGTTTEIENVPAGIYVLMNINDVVGFYQTKNAFTVGANTAYLPAIVMPGARAFISLDGEEATGIAEVKGIAAEQQVYDLQGRRVAQPVKGLYIVNGRKVVVK